jgi:kynurenine formamidase
MESPAERPARGLGSESRGGPSDDPAGTPRSGSRRLIELSHQIHHGMVTYPGLPGPELSDYLPREASPARYGPGTEFHIGRISMVANTGTYLDSPFHRFAGATDVAGLPLYSVADLDGVVVRVGAGRRAIDRDALASYNVRGRAVLVHTGWDRYWGTERYGTGNPFLTAAAADWLVEQQAGLVGIDSLNIDDTGGRRARCTRRCWRLASRSWSTCAGLPSSRRAAFASTPPRPRSSASAPSRSAPTPSWPMGRPATVRVLSPSRAREIEHRRAGDVYRALPRPLKESLVAEGEQTGDCAGTGWFFLLSRKSR